ncbi:TerB family tellurite resistance protein [Mucilaginibacter sp. BJC16-A38]|nr:TerB family tellurite resistance protein [Mucilaginibacter phenanthrenivorans]
MRRGLVFLAGLAGLFFGSMGRASAQSSDMQQLILDIEKLTQFKAILSDMKTGYTILTQGYGEVKDLSQGNFNLHSAFLNSLEAVSPEVRKYGRIADIIANQARIVSEGKAMMRTYSGSGHFSAGELLYMNNVFNQLLKGSVDNLTNLANVLTAGTLRMSDAERLQQIDQLYDDTQHKLVFLRYFDNSVQVLLVQRLKEQNDADELKRFAP